MIWTHVWLCNRFVWRFVTFAARAAMPHIGPKLALARLASMGGIGLCAGGFAFPPDLNVPPPPPVERVVIISPGPGVYGGGPDVVPVNTPEPWSIAVFGVAVAGVVAVRRGR